MLKGNKKVPYQKYTPKMNYHPTHHFNDELTNSSPRKGFETNSSRYSKAPYLQEDLIDGSSRIANETYPINRGYQEFQSSILKKVEDIERENHELLQKKQRELYFIKTELNNNEARLQDAQQSLRHKDQQLQDLRSQLHQKPHHNNLLSRQQSISLINQNQQLKQSLRILIDQKNQTWKNQHKTDNNPQLIQGFKSEVLDLKEMVEELQKMVHNCQSCYTLKRSLEEINQSYQCLLKQHTQLRKQTRNKQENLLTSITHKIQENQNILRENNHLKQKHEGRPYYLRPKRQKLKESVAKRCRTLTDQF